jgi:hypothetical protein
VDSQPPPPSLPPPSDDANVDPPLIIGALPGAASVLPADIQGVFDLSQNTIAMLMGCNL